MKKADIDRSLIKALLYGAPGTTKTRTSASAVFVDQMKPVLMLESGGNPLSIRDFPDISIMSIETMKDYNLPYDWLYKGQPEDHPFATILKNNDVWQDDVFNTIIIDGLTETQNFMFKAVRPGMDVPVGDVPVGLEIQHFNQILAMMNNWASKFFKLPMHVILTSLEAEKQQGSMTEIYRRPLLWGQSQGVVASYAYIVMRLSSAEYMDTRTRATVANDIAAVKASRFVGFVHESGSFYAKEQYGMFDKKTHEQIRYILDPDMRKIWDAIY